VFEVPSQDAWGPVACRGKGTGIKIAGRKQGYPLELSRDGGSVAEVDGKRCRRPGGGVSGMKWGPPSNDRPSLRKFSLLLLLTMELSPSWSFDNGDIWKLSFRKHLFVLRTFENTFFSLLKAYSAKTPVSEGWMYHYLALPYQFIIQR